MLAPKSPVENVYMREGLPLVAKVPHANGEYLPFTVAEAVAMLGGIERAIRPGDQVLVKPNFNCSYSTPLSTDLAFLAAAISCCRMQEPR